MKNKARKIALLILGAFALQIGGPSEMAGAQTNLDNIGGAISSLRGQKARKIDAAQNARSKARAQAQQVEFLRARLLKTRRILNSANENYIDSFRQMQRTEERIEEIKARSQQVAARYQNHKQQFGLRLASMQRHGQTNFLQVALGSMSLSDLSRRTAFFQALTQRDAALQAQIKSDRAELLEAQNSLLAQWNERKALQQKAAREKNRIAQGEAQQMQSWKEMNNARYALIAFANQQQRSLEDIDGKIGGLRARESEVVAQNQARQERANAQEARTRLAQFRAQAAREREEMRAQATFRSRTRRRVVRTYKRSASARRVASQERQNTYRSRYGNSRAQNRRSRYTRRSSPRSYARDSTRTSRRYSSVSRVDPQNLPQFAPRVGLMPRYAPRIELAPMPIEALQNPAKFTLPSR